MPAADILKDLPIPNFVGRRLEEFNDILLF
jgi:hypothetical protein